MNIHMPQNALDNFVHTSILSSWCQHRVSVSNLEFQTSRLSLKDIQSTRGHVVSGRAAIQTQVCGLPNALPLPLCQPVKHSEGLRGSQSDWHWNHASVAQQPKQFGASCFNSLRLNFCIYTIYE